jgi:hypothetical protein
MDLIDLEIKRTEHRAAEEGISPSMVAQKALDAAQGTVELSDRCASMAVQLVAGGGVEGMHSAGVYSVIREGMQACCYTAGYANTELSCTQ